MASDSVGPLRLVLVRHGEAAANREMRYLGRLDDDLTPHGRGQARALAGPLAEIGPKRVISSPLTRARRTAAVIADGSRLVLEIDSRLQEMDFGSWDGRTRADVAADDPDLLAQWERDPDSIAPPGGESLGDVRARVLDMLTELASTTASGPVVLVSHVGPLKVVLCEALGLEARAMARLFLDPATVSVVDWAPRRVVRLFNSHAHLGWTNARWMTGP